MGLMVKIDMYKKRNLAEIQKEMIKNGELVNEQNTITRSENILGQALIDAHIPVIPQYEVSGRSFDFKIYHYPILLEVDGTIHNTNKKRLSDAVKDRFVIRRGYKVLRFLNQEFDNPTYLKKAIGEIRSTIRFCGKQPREVHLYPLTIWEQIKMWIQTMKGKKFPYSLKVEFLK
jgi:very-short-patch-repair endonuclease